MCEHPDPLPVIIICYTELNTVKQARQKQEQPWSPTPSNSRPPRIYRAEVGVGPGQEVRRQILQVPLSADAQKIIFLSQHRYFDTALRFWAFFFK